MQKNFIFYLLLSVLLAISMVFSCKKEVINNGSQGISVSFTEEFDSVHKLPAKGWYIKDNSRPTLDAQWMQGMHGYDKSGIMTGFPAYSYTHTEDEFIKASPITPSNAQTAVSSWLITPLLSIKNGDRISFYTRTVTGTDNSDRLQVLINNMNSTKVGDNATSVGDFKISIIDINPMQATNGYPKQWTKYEHVFTGISGQLDTRVAFRYYVPNNYVANFIGIDLFRFETN